MSIHDPPAVTEDPPSWGSSDRILIRTKKNTPIFLWSPVLRASRKLPFGIYHVHIVIWKVVEQNQLVLVHFRYFLLGRCGAPSKKSENRKISKISKIFKFFKIKKMRKKCFSFFYDFLKNTCLCIELDPCCSEMPRSCCFRFFFYPENKDGILVSLKPEHGPTDHLSLEARIVW